MSEMLNKYCAKLFGKTGVIIEIGVVKKVSNRTIHVDWGKKTWIYQNKDFIWVPLTKEEFETRYKKPKFSDGALIRAAELELKITYN
ncbi:hypothetical protein GCM10008018_65060 [Paenibacillus marchantiophytorum]|uniref:Uncharacterized protein n=1 Tax=Paenibacillus marchantiophytorum TaxID=1619310 RepID=A0ABQ1FHF9_9BACL|nr:hypothetical protein [Paenibacillus marchantiophytorum]GGA10768.1 hypothetical protein GCM10008018_65060 [Paenibacillus marchantiophytorum]